MNPRRRRPVSPLRVAALAGAALAAGVPAAARAQEPRIRTADSLITIALDRARNGDTAAALQNLERATRVAPRYAPAYYQRGLILSRGSSLGLGDVFQRRAAGEAIKHALELDADNPLYLMELGRLRLKTPFLRIEAERLFRRALDVATKRQDPRVLAEVRWELGQIFERRYITMANRRMLLGSTAVFDPARAVNDWHYTADFLSLTSAPIPDAGELDYKKSEEHYRAALLADSAHLGAALGLLGLMAETDRYEEMIATTEQLRTALPNEPRLYMALGLALHRLDREVEAAGAFDTAGALFPPEESRELFALDKLLRKDAAQTYDKMDSTARRDFESLFWNLSDPLRLTDVNEARLEYLARVTYADLRFSSPEFRQRGWLTDRGSVLIRYGPPNVVASIAPEAGLVNDAETMARVTTVWWYPDAKMSFVFVGPPAMNYSFFAGDFRAYAENARFVMPYSFHNLEARLPVDSVPVQVARFRGEQPGITDVSFFAALPMRQLLKETDVAQATVEAGLFITDEAQRLLVSARDSTVVRLNRPDAVSARAWHRPLRPGDYRYRVEARQSASGRSARGMAALDVPFYADGAFALSDLLVANRIAPRTPGTPPHSRADLFIEPNGALAFARGDTIFVYYETYGLTRDSTGRARARVDLALRVDQIQRSDRVQAVVGGLLDKVGLTAEGDDRVTLSYERSVAADALARAPDYLAIGIGSSPNGVYTLEIRVTDLATGRTATQQRVLRVHAP